MLFSTSGILGLLATGLLASAEMVSHPVSQARHALVKRAGTTLTKGGSYTVGSITPKLLFQSSGVISSVGCWRKYRIRACYMLYLGPKGMLQVDGDVTTFLAGGSISDGALAAAINDLDLVTYYSSFPDSALPYAFGDYADGRLEQRDSIPESGAVLARRAALASYCPGYTNSSSNATTTTTTASATSASTSASATVAPRQRIEFFSWPAARATTTFRYSWKSYLVPVSTSDHFFHIFQMLRRDCTGGPVITLDVKNVEGNPVVVIDDFIRDCGSSCPSVPLSQWTGRTLQNTIVVTWGPNGQMNYTAADINTPTKPLLFYSATGDMGATASLKFGMYRLATKSMSEARALVGDYQIHRIH